MHLVEAGRIERKVGDRVSKTREFLIVSALALTALGACGDDSERTASETDGTEAVQAESERPLGDPDAIGRCEGRTFAVGADAKLVGAFSTDIRTIRGWLPRITVSGDDLPPGLRGKPDSHPVSVCFIDAQFATPGPPGHATPTRAVFYADDQGNGEPFRFGTPAELPVERPAGTPRS